MLNCRLMHVLRVFPCPGYFDGCFLGIQWCFDYVLKVCFKCVSMGVSRIFQGFFKNVLIVFVVVSKKFYSSFWVFQRYSQDVYSVTCFKLPITCKKVVPFRSYCTFHTFFWLIWHQNQNGPFFMKQKRQFQFVFYFKVLP